MPKKSTKKATWEETLGIAGSVEKLLAAGWSQKTIDNNKNRKGEIVASSALSDLLLEWWRGKHKPLIEERLRKERERIAKDRAELKLLARRAREAIDEMESRAG